MHTTFVVIAGLVLHGTCLLVTRLLGCVGTTEFGTLTFLPLWLVGSGINIRFEVTSEAACDKQIRLGYRPLALSVQYHLPVSQPFSVLSGRISTKYWTPPR
jgi:hypothetical protein